MSHGRFLNDLSDDESAIDVSELPSEYRVKLNGFLRNACNDGHETLTRVLLDKGADVNYITTNTQLPTALHVAVSNTREHILPILLPQASSATIQAALQYAIQYRERLTTIIRILQQDGSPLETSDNLDKDLDKNSVESTKKSDPPEQKENETQTASPSQQETETQTNGEHSDPQTRQTDTLSSSSDLSSPSPSSSLSPSTPPPHEEIAGSNELKEPTTKHEIDISHLQKQLHEQQQQLLAQQHKLHAQEVQHEDAQRKAAHSQQAVEQAQRDLEEMRGKLQKQEEHIDAQNKQVQNLTEQLGEYEAQAQAHGAQLATQVALTQNLTEAIATHEEQTQKLRDEVHAQLDQIEQLRKRIAELEGENKELAEKFESEKHKSETAAQEFQNQIDALHQDIESKTTKLDSVSKERDTERRAKEVARRMLTSAGPRDSVDNLTLGHSHAIRMASVVSPTPPDEPTQFPTPSSPTFSRASQRIQRNAATLNGFVSPRAPPSDPFTEGGPKKHVPRVGPKLGSRSRAKDDMDIASEADRARVKRLVERWEELKYLELKHN
eukprot:Phypoly_transcript_00331.p2 GENE.Phypoly_transcript_00331~~Phypoly_transcript_00331.p2  ORF type:complete len:553 (+),score=154.02 Phypoly_transcript_00331:133-1791(+)